ncbi:radical SAM protein [Streptomyces sp. ISL-1]|uniref:Rv1681 family radical SAM protein n=1 Tax=Streptomyces sp. ISL-1 TaxID=2817657 RepID=UPI0020361D8E|nr:radical SAM protein [Streptomyces sp. ISL-1]
MVILELAEKVSSTADGDTVTLPVASPDEAELAAAWCARTGNTLVAADGTSVTVRRGRPPDPIAALRADRRPGARLWLYTNFDCNLACDYCCARSSPQTARRALGVDRVQQIAKAAPAAGVSEILLTGGEPFILPDLDEIFAHRTAALPTTLLTNGMLFRGRRLQMLQAMPRDRLILQISLDSATPDLHDSHRGKGTWAKAVAGIRTALGEGFTVRVAATLTTDDRHEERDLRAFLDSLGIAREHQVVRPLAHEGAADDGLELTVQTLIPESHHHRRRRLLAPGRSRQRRAARHPRHLPSRCRHRSRVLRPPEHGGLRRPHVPLRVSRAPVRSAGTRGRAAWPTQTPRTPHPFEQSAHGDRDPQSVPDGHGRNDNRIPCGQGTSRSSGAGAGRTGCLRRRRVPGYGPWPRRLRFGRGQRQRQGERDLVGIGDAVPSRSGSAV